VAGGSASGKTTVCDRIYQRLHDDSAVVILSQDSFYKGLTEPEKLRVNDKNWYAPRPVDQVAHTLLQVA
jgi:uridine kinase